MVLQCASGASAQLTPDPWRVQAKCEGGQAVPLAAQEKLHKLTHQLLKRQSCRDSIKLGLQSQQQAFISDADLWVGSWRASCHPRWTEQPPTHHPQLLPSWPPCRRALREPCGNRQEPASSGHTCAGHAACRPCGRTPRSGWVLMRQSVWQLAAIASSHTCRAHGVGQWCKVRLQVLRVMHEWPPGGLAEQGQRSCWCLGDQ